MLKINGRTKEEIFSSFHKKWRYNIRVAERKGVECRICGRESLDDFYGLMKETGESRLASVLEAESTLNG